MELYKNLGYTIGKYPAVSINCEDHVLAGPGGFIWEYRGGEYRACELCGKNAERIIKFFEKDLDYYVRKFKIPFNKVWISKQVYWANNPNARHD